MTKWVVKRSDGGVSVMDIRDGENVEAIIAKHAARWKRKHEARLARGEPSVLWEPVSHFRLTDAPKDRAFRGAWKGSRGAVLVDMPKARDVHLDRIREARDKVLRALDVETMKAVGAGDEARRAEVEAEKQRLRDLPQTFDLSEAGTPEELKALWPPELAED